MSSWKSHINDPPLIDEFQLMHHLCVCLAVQLVSLLSGLSLELHTVSLISPWTKRTPTQHSVTVFQDYAGLLKALCFMKQDVCTCFIRKDLTKAASEDWVYIYISVLLCVLEDARRLVPVNTSCCRVTHFVCRTADLFWKPPQVFFDISSGSDFPGGWRRRWGDGERERERESCCSIYPTYSNPRAFTRSIRLFFSLKISHTLPVLFVSPSDRHTHINKPM